MVRRGQLPSRRVGGPYNARYLIPHWAVDGLVGRRGAGDPRADPDQGPSAAAGERVRVLENALAAVREVREHEQRAHALQLEASRELGMANEILHRAVTDVLVPPIVP